MYNKTIENGKWKMENKLIIFFWHAEANDIRGVYEHFMAWVSSNGAEHAEWYLESADAGRIY